VPVSTGGFVAPTCFVGLVERTVVRVFASGGVEVVVPGEPDRRQSPYSSAIE
jgi:hypothetical protein